MRFAAALLVAAAAAVALGIALAFGFGGLSAIPATLALAGGIAVGGFAFRGMRREESRPIHPVEWTLIGVFTLVSLRAFFWLVYERNNEIFVLSPNNLGDLPLHVDFIRYLASGVHFWPDSPIFAGEPLKYPLGADFFNSLLLDAGVPLEQGLLWVALAGSAVTAAALWRWGRGFALAAFLFGGGLTAFALFLGIVPLNEWTTDFQAKTDWKNLFLAIFVTQRGMLFALPAGLFLLDDWRSRFLRGERGLLPIWAAIFLYATLPLFSVHAFLYLSVALAAMFACGRDSATRWKSLRFVAVAFVPATLCAAFVTGGFSAGGGVHWEPGWMQPKGQGIGAIAWYWLSNFGLYLILWFALAIRAIIRRDREALAITLPATLMFLVCGFVSFAPWPWDNTKILLWCWLAVAPCLWAAFLQPLHWAARATVCFALFFTGAVSLNAGLDGRHGYSIVDARLVAGTARAVQNLPPESRFACAQEYWHPLIFLGRKVAMGYEGHLFSHGLTYKGRNADKVRAFKNLMEGEPGWEESARQLGVDYLYWGTAESDRYPLSREPWIGKLPVAAEGESFTLYAFPKR